MKYFLLLLFTLITFSLKAQHKFAYKIFTAEGKKVSYAKMLKQIDREGAIVLFGELHNNAIAHWLQLAISKDLHERNKLVLGAEMLEADDQIAVNLYLKDSITVKELDSLAGLWPNFKTDYAPLLSFASNNDIPFIATNIPRRYANLVYQKGLEALDTLSKKEKNWIAPLPIDYDPELPGYKKMQKMAHGHGGENLPKAQAIKDATMAHSILKNYQPDHIFLHINGRYHSDNYEGILWYLQKQRPNINYFTISTVEQTSVEELNPDNKNKADYIIVVDDDVTNTY